MEKSVLIIIDMVQDYFNRALWPDSRIPDARQRLTREINDLTTRFRDKNLPVIWFRQEFSADLSDAFPHMRLEGRRYAIKGSNGSLLLPELNVGSNDTIMVKKRYSAFYGTKLESVLQQLEARTIVLAGITSAWCVKSTGIDAFQRDYQLIFALDCMEGFTENDHVRAVESMESVLGPFLSNEKIDELLSSV